MGSRYTQIADNVLSCIPSRSPNILKTYRSGGGIILQGLPYVNANMIKMIDDAGKQWRVKSSDNLACMQLEIFTGDTTKDYNILQASAPVEHTPPKHSVTANEPYTTTVYVVDKLDVNQRLIVTQAMYSDFVNKCNTQTDNTDDKTVLPPISNCIIEGYTITVIRPKKTISRQPYNRLLSGGALFHVYKKKIDRRRLRLYHNKMVLRRKAAKPKLHGPSP